MTQVLGARLRNRTLSLFKTGDTLAARIALQFPESLASTRCTWARSSTWGVILLVIGLAVEPRLAQLDRAALRLSAERPRDEPFRRSRARAIRSDPAVPGRPAATQAPPKSRQPSRRVQRDPRGVGGGRGAWDRRLLGAGARGKRAQLRIPGQGSAQRDRAGNRRHRLDRAARDCDRDAAGDPRGPLPDRVRAGTGQLCSIRCLP